MASSLPTCPPPFKSFNELETEAPDSDDFYELTDRLAIQRLVQVSAEVHAYYGKYEFFKGVNTVNKYISNDLSAFYFETLKDRIYTGDKRDCETLQRALGLIFYELLQMLSPICPLLVEEVWDHVPTGLKENSVHPARATWLPLQPRTDDAFALDSMNTAIAELGTAIKIAQERLRADKKIGSSLESAVSVYMSDTGASDLAGLFVNCVHPDCFDGEDVQSQFAGVFVVSELNVRVWGNADGKVYTGDAQDGTQVWGGREQGEFEVEDVDSIKSTWAWCEEEVV